MNIKVGSPVNTKHGTGVVIGFERFDGEGKSAPYADTFKGKERIILTLDAGHTWCFDGNYALFVHEYLELNPPMGEWVSLKDNPPTESGVYLAKYLGSEPAYWYFRDKKNSYSDSQWCVQGKGDIKPYTGHSWQGALPDQWLKESQGE